MLQRDGLRAGKELLQQLGRLGRGGEVDRRARAQATAGPARRGPGQGIGLGFA